MWRVAMCVCIAATACVASSPAVDSLVETLPAPTANCPNGGVEIETGLDVNHDGQLEASEVTSTQYVCAPAGAAPAELVRVVPEPDGSNCPAGGVAIESGKDTNGNGVLDDDEVTSTSYVCAGQNGSNGANGSNGVNGSDAPGILVRIEPEPAGSNCAAGGEAILVGADLNGDGILEADEVEDTAYLCGALALPTVIDGDYNIANDQDVAALAGVTDITGNLTYSSSTLTTISLPNLLHVGGFSMPNLDAHPIPLTAISMPALVSVGPTDEFYGPPGTFSVRPFLPTTIDLPNLQSAELEIYDSGSDALSFPSLQTGLLNYQGNAVSISTTLERGDVIIEGAPNLASISLDSFTIGSVEIVDSPSLQALSLPVMTTSVGVFYNSPGISVANTNDSTGPSHLVSVSAPNLISGNVGLSATLALTTLDLSSLQSGSVGLNGTALASLSLPSLTAATEVSALDCPEMTSFSAPNLGSGTTFFIVENDPLLPTCMAQQLAQQCAATTVEISGTDDSATCP